ncbi:hypothetical protein [Acinetobacter baumannii]|nr:hypothetical protein [Acinetobacter baumannii]WDC50557.1 hypothetical protein PTC93_19350 [Acinetobacter baumannii]
MLLRDDGIVVDVLILVGGLYFVSYAGFLIVVLVVMVLMLLSGGIGG